MSDLLTTAELAAELKISVSSVSTWKHEGVITPAINRFRANRWVLADVIAQINEDSKRTERR